VNSWIASEEFEKRGTEGTSGSSVVCEMLVQLLRDVSGCALISLRVRFKLTKDVGSETSVLVDLREHLWLEGS
jgi:hypothetical protein